MSTENTVTIVGNLTRDVELKFTASGMAVANFGVAVNNRRKNSSGEYEDDTSFFDVSCFGSMAENLAESATRGTRVVVTGRMEQRSWETKEGDKRSKVEVIADEVGPSLRWATAVVTKKAANGNGAPRQPVSSRAPAPVAAPAEEYEPF